MFNADIPQDPYQQDIDRERELLSYTDIPDNAKDKYELFKTYTATWFFIRYKYEFLETTHNREGKAFTQLVEARMYELDKFRKHPRLRLPERHNTNLRANSYINNLIFGTVPYSNNETTEDEIIYNILLHENEVFNTVELPDELFYIYEMTTGSYNKLWRIMTIGEYYAEYFLLYNYLKGLLDSNATETPKTKPSITHEIFKPPVWIGPNIQEQLIQLLSEPFNNTPFIKKSEGKLIWNKRNDFAQFSAGLFQELTTKEWINIKDLSTYQLRDIFANTFGIIISEKVYRQVRLNEVKDKYTSPFRDIINKLTA